MAPAQLVAELKRCTREDGTIGLVSVCKPCHRRAERKHPTEYKTPGLQQRAERNRKLDTAAKLAHGECECGDDNCHHLVTTENVESFEWDHLVQSFDDPDDQGVGGLVSRGAAPSTCDRERAKWRLLYDECHARHTAQQKLARMAAPH